MQQEILDMLLKEDEITWQSILYDLVKSEKMDPWDIDISILSQKYLEIVKQLQETNFFVSGKIILASAILLKLKSNKLLTDHIASFDNLLFHQDIEELDDFEVKNQRIKLMENPRLTIKNPQARKRKVSLNDLVSALEKALEVDKRRTMKKIESERIKIRMELPEKTIDISVRIKDLYQKIVDFFTNLKKETITFSSLVPSNKKQDKIITILPLLHLSNDEKIMLSQQEHFGEIEISKPKL